MDCTLGDKYMSLDSDAVAALPEEIASLLVHGSNAQFLESLAVLALDPRWTSTIFISFEPLFVDICNRWRSGAIPQAEPLNILTALACILPCAPHLSEFVKESIYSAPGGVYHIFFSQRFTNLSEISDGKLMCLLLSLTRLMEFDNETYASAISPVKLQLLLGHSQRSIRCLAIKLLCMFLHAQEATFAEMVSRHIGNSEICGPWEHEIIDYRFYTLWEEQRLTRMRTRLLDQEAAIRTQRTHRHTCKTITDKDLSTSTLSLAGVLFSRRSGEEQRSSSLIMTQSTTYNIRLISEAILRSRAVLVTGPSSGKTAIIKDIARILGKGASSLTLHLNEQTDAKLLIGLYTTSGAPGSFSWQPGILTTAAKEGRWVIIEDLNRAPVEVLSILLPLLDRGELLVPNLGGTVRASPEFKLIATIRSTVDVKDKGFHVGGNLLGIRNWRQVLIRPLCDEELREIIASKYPVLKAYQTLIMNVYNNIKGEHHITYAKSKSIEQQDTPALTQTLLRCCRRLQDLLLTAGVSSGDKSISESLYDDLFLEIVDSFGSSLQSDKARASIIAQIAQEMHIAPERAHFLTQLRIPNYSDTEQNLRIGRVTLHKRKESGSRRRVKKQGKKQIFALTPHAKRLCESLSVAIKMREPCLLVGETGIGKTAVIHQLANSLGYNLVVVNLSRTSETGDLLGGYKPVSLKSLAIPMKDVFDELFDITFSSEKNQHFVTSLGHKIAKGDWDRVLNHWEQALRMAEDSFGRLGSDVVDHHRPRKRQRRKIDSPAFQKLKIQWQAFANQVRMFEKHLRGGAKGFAFSFVESNIVKAVKNGDWVLLDEINLASQDTLESVTELLSFEPDVVPYLLLSETGKAQKIKAHPNFRIFGAMNPATDIGKKNLPVSVRSKFTEYLIQPPDKDLSNLVPVIEKHLKDYKNTDTRIAKDAARLYMEIRSREEANKLVDGAGQRPHFSLRTLTRTVNYAVAIAPIYGLRRALYEGFSMTFLTLLDKESEILILPLIERHILGAAQARRGLLSQLPRSPDDGKSYVRFKHYWMPQGPNPLQEQPNYIITPWVERNLLNLVRATSTRRFPVLLQGPTSSGKTSLVEYLAKISGNTFVRVNNHEHTDLQEYLGSYVSGPTEQLQYQDGVLVQALRKGHWIVLDELNLAPSDILEALNRLLDDNRELLVPETQEVVHPHENFMLFATQNPPGFYGGRNTLSRAFRNRFLELHFDDIPDNELEIILRERSQIAPSFCARIVKVYQKLAVLRQSGQLLKQSHGFTLRDLFRWALRDADDWEKLARNGFMLLAERSRDPEERLVVKRTIEEVMKVSIDESRFYDEAHLLLSDRPTQFSSTIVWTTSMRRLYTLVVSAINHKEPVLLVGEPGCGKTTICQIVAEAMHTHLHVVNAHQNTETGDIIGAQRPIRNRSAIEAELAEALSNLLIGHHTSYVGHEFSELMKIYNGLAPDILQNIPQDLRHQISQHMVKTASLFEWSDGSLVHAMKDGQFFLLDEISLADDSVLERLNSVLEPSRTLLLAEKASENVQVVAVEGFQFLATMNPGGDYGKRELSPALRNRFTEIWVPPLSDDLDLLEIVHAKLSPEISQFAQPIIGFSKWFNTRYRQTSTVSLREVLAWISFMNTYQCLDPYFKFLHGAAMVYIDGIGAKPATKLPSSSYTVQQDREECLVKLSELSGHNVATIYHEPIVVSTSDQYLAFGNFQLQKRVRTVMTTDFSLDAPTTANNAMKIVRALQLHKPILIEGSPGVGKTTLVTTLANTIGMPLTRINLSEQTDIMDLFGSDVPTEGHAGQFAWHDAPFLRAMKNGEWILLDEMNLASQSVLEGLNACLDHRGEVYIPELDQTFFQHPGFLVFAAQNPHYQGGGRKGLPASFVNRFTVVYADVFTSNDLSVICRELYPKFTDIQINDLIRWVLHLSQATSQDKGLFTNGGPWEFNLRDILKWLQLLSSQDSLMPAANPSDYHNLLFIQRFRSHESINALRQILTKRDVPLPNSLHSLFCDLSSSSYQVGLGLLPRRQTVTGKYLSQPNSVSQFDLSIMESLMICVQHRWPCLLVGYPSKANVMRHIANNVGADLVEFPMSPEMDTMDLIGGYEQVDVVRHNLKAIERLRIALTDAARKALSQDEISSTLLFLEQLLSLNVREHQKLMTFLQRLNKASVLSALSPIIQDCEASINALLTRSGVQFEWVDGILVQAMKAGQWLVLDNANLCNSSVLDRLNSLLEPNGVLVINEHRSPNGSVETIRPHPDFRLFLTMDPRHGELSRAMRNRCTEIYTAFDDGSPDLHIWRGCHDASMSRYRPFQLIEWNSFDNDDILAIAKICFDHLAYSDFSILQQWYKQVNSGLLNIHPSNMPALSTVFRAYIQTIDLRKKIFTNSSLSKIPHMQQNFCDVQMHPLNNPVLLRLLPDAGCHCQIVWLSTCLELAIELEFIGCLVVDIRQALPQKSRFQLSVLERSIVSSQSLIFSKESTQPIAGFIDSMREGLLNWIATEAPTLGGNTEMEVLVEDMVLFVRDLFDLARVVSFDEAVFQVYLSQARSLVLRSQTVNSLHSLTNTLITHLENFRPSWSLSTGTSMENLWQIFRSETAATMSHLEGIMRVENLADRFDDIARCSGASTQRVATLRHALAEVYPQNKLSKSQDINKFEDLESVLDEAKKIADLSTTPDLPCFRHEFEGLRQYLSLDSSKKFEDVCLLDTLAGRPSRLSLCLGRGSDAYNLLLQISRFTGIDQGHSALMTIRNTLAVSIFSILKNISNIPLGLLETARQELRLLASTTTDVSKWISGDQYRTLNSYLSGIIFNILDSHDSYFQAESLSICKQHLKSYPHGFSSIILPQLKENTSVALYEASSFDNFRIIWKTHLEPAIDCLYRAAKEVDDPKFSSSVAWIHTFVACLKLYVPDRQFDPALKEKIERERCGRRRKELQQKFQALKFYEGNFHGQKRSYRSDIVQNALDSMENGPLFSRTLLRPEVSELGKLQGEFTSILQAVVSRCADLGSLQPHGTTSSDEPEDLQLIRRNIRLSISRLTSSYRAYDDISKPVIGLLKGLDVGLGLILLDSDSNLGVNKTIETVYNVTPLFGLVPEELAQISIKDIDVTSDSGCHLGLLHLKLGILQQKVELQPTEVTTATILKTFHKFYEAWRQQLEKDQMSNTAKSSLYHYRGTQEHGEDFDEDEYIGIFSNSIEYQSKFGTPKQMACTLAQYQHNLCRGNLSPSDLTLAMIDDSTDFITRLWKGKDNLIFPIHAEDALPGVILSLHSSCKDLLDCSGKNPLFNFYTDANLVEALKLVKLLKRIQIRFQEIQAVWPEHALLTDILRNSDEILGFRHVEPLAKIITKAETLHGYIYEWQTMASRQYSASGLYDELTGTIIDWRRLELSTWAQLLDMEDQSCRNDAMSWWFVVYEAIIAGPLSVIASKSGLPINIKELIATLRKFLYTSAIGQYSHGLLLIRQFKDHVRLLAKDEPQMQAVYAALANFVSFFSKFEPRIQETIQQGRKALEKAMKEILLLASWKDTNINALRESSRRSHHKLFNVVKKYRTILKQPSEKALSQGFPPILKNSIAVITAIQPTPISLDIRAVRKCTDELPTWIGLPKRLTDSLSTVTNMVRLSKLPDAAIDCSLYIDSFATDLDDAIALLRETTPSVSTEENRDTIKHLKSQKKKLFADTLKGLRKMGFKSNLGTELLSKQASLTTILSTTPVLVDGNMKETGDARSSEDYFHSFLADLEITRDSAGQGTAELTSREASRSLGYLEGILSVLLRQRTTLSSALEGFRRLSRSLATMRNLWAPDSYIICKSAQMENVSADLLERRLRWLLSILETSMRIIEMYDGMRERHSSSEVLEGLASWKTRFMDLVKAIEDVPQLPFGLQTSQSKTIHENTKEAFKQMDDHLRKIQKENPELSFVIKKITHWTTPVGATWESRATVETDIDLPSFQSKLLGVIDSTLVGVQHLQSLQSDLISVEDPAWLTRTEASLAKSLKNLQAHRIADEIDSTLSHIQRLNCTQPGLQSVVALSAVALPVLQQYHNTHQEIIGRYSSFLGAICRMSYILSTSFKTMMTHSFYNPPEKSGPEDGETKEVEGGTGLGDGQGSEDISKDIGDDEDLSELANERNKEGQGIEGHDEAIDMGPDELEAEMEGATNEKDDSQADSESNSAVEDELDEETGEVDDLDPSTVDEKMWDESGDAAKRDKKSEKSKGTKQEEISGQDDPDEDVRSDQEDAEDQEEAGEGGVEEGEQLAQEEGETLDPHVQDGQNLDLPEDIDFDGNDNDSDLADSDGMEGLSDVDLDSPDQDELQDNEAPEALNQKAENQSSSDIGDEPEDTPEKTLDDGSTMEIEPEGDVETNDLDLLKDDTVDATVDPDQATSSQAQGGGESTDLQNDIKDAHESGKHGVQDRESENVESKNTASHGEDGETEGTSRRADAVVDSQDERVQDEDESENPVFKKLGDTLEKWRRLREQIQDTQNNNDRESDQSNQMDVDTSDSKFEHLPNDEATADAQALGSATEDQANVLDKQAFDSEATEYPRDILPNDEQGTEMADQMMEDIEPRVEKSHNLTSESRQGAIIGDNLRDSTVQDSHGSDAKNDQDEDLEMELSNVNAENEHSLRTLDEARQLWSHYENITRILSLSLTEELRLILAPTLATKMRGDFRTGKRLNIKRIIPFIASQYRRDKIWMRRTVPSKRNYQIMLAIDDSKSIGESGSGPLALETLALISKSLSMLEVGQISIVRFGEDVYVAHDFEQPFSSEAGMRVFQQFGFRQLKTNVRKLVQESTEIFRHARSRSSMHAGTVDLWQLELIISDGICEDHDSIRRLVRQAREERIMMVFVIVDALKGDSIFNMTQAIFEVDVGIDGTGGTGEMKLRTKRYLDDFPFEHFLVVGDVRELPRVLAEALRRWFAEVVVEGA